MSKIIEVKVPKIGESKKIPVAEIIVKAGDVVRAEDPIIVLESDQTTMKIPVPISGVVDKLKVKIGDEVSEGTPIITLITGDPSVSPEPLEIATPSVIVDTQTAKLPHAGPGVRKLARALGIDLSRIVGSGKYGRIVQEDLERLLTQNDDREINIPVASNGTASVDCLNLTQVNFAKFGPVETKPLGRVRQISAANLHRNWVTIPHVTNHDEADITDLESFRLQINREMKQSSIRVSILSFVIKAAAATLKKFPEFNTSLNGENLIFKYYYHIGFATDTENGLVVPVIHDADQKGVVEIAKEVSALTKLARDGKIKTNQLQGGTFTITSLGSIGGIYFTPIINAPEVAIMGISKAYWKQVSPDGKQCSWRYMLPLSLSWNHQVIDGASAAKFNVHFAKLLFDMRWILI
jgi:pyruvate dehydrogenase E2 component (dihydrolipoamide acetyltransferase)